MCVIKLELIAVPLISIAFVGHPRLQFMYSFIHNLYQYYFSCSKSTPTSLFHYILKQYPAPPPPPLPQNPKAHYSPSVSFHIRPAHSCSALRILRLLPCHTRALMDGRGQWFSCGVQARRPHDPLPSLHPPYPIFMRNRPPVPHHHHTNQKKKKKTLLLLL